MGNGVLIYMHDLFLLGIFRLLLLKMKSSLEMEHKGVPGRWPGPDPVPGSQVLSRAIEDATMGHSGLRSLHLRF